MEVKRVIFILCAVFAAIMVKNYLFPEFDFWIDALIAGSVGGGAALLSNRLIKD